MSLQKNPTTGLVIELFGPTLEFMTSPDDEHNDFCVLKGTIPPDGYVPLHSHPDTEDFLVISGAVEGLRQEAGGNEWVEARAGDYIHVPADAPHAWRNVSSEVPVVDLIITTKRLARFLQETGRPVTGVPQPPTREELERFAAVSARYGYWNATPEENAAVGIPLSF
jgi:quercetin dioxygenase-like cupin family protein